MSSEPLTAEQIEELKKRHIRSFCMRRGHISNAQEKALEELLPLYEIPYDANQKFDAVKTFGNNNPLVLEIGCGMGETTAAIAQAHPEINFIGCEVFAAGVGALSKRHRSQECPNLPSRCGRSRQRHAGRRILRRRAYLLPGSLEKSTPSQTSSD